ncbi:hypothetical protein HJA82_29275 [Rhizobium bangladeshense]|uniref:hypothetical protein n=1 Tax=Rhizobium TaxID=379 RepID=UPI001C83F509|nr:MULTISPECIES: hypothetical protein [Rhizobium]MBX4911407.1 hypothetical protein [Rhizobium bangladeshense]MBX5130701.1 hypothetical protein [Rhizobium lentis]
MMPAIITYIILAWLYLVGAVVTVFVGSGIEGLYRWRLALAALFWPLTWLYVLLGAAFDMIKDRLHV